MKKNILIGLMVLPLSLVAGCASEPPANVDESSDEAEPAGAALDIKLSGLEALAGAVMAHPGPAALPPIEIPGDRLLPSAFQSDTVRGALLDTKEPFTRILNVGAGRDRFESSTWALETGDHGSVLALRKAPWAGV